MSIASTIDLQEGGTLMNCEKYLGLDVHQATIPVAVMDHTGKLVMEWILETKASTILEFFAGLRGSLSVAFEEATWVVRQYTLAAKLLQMLLVPSSRRSHHSLKILPDLQHQLVEDGAGW